MEQITEIQNKLQKRKWEGSCILTVTLHFHCIAGPWADGAICQLRNLRWHDDVIPKRS
jgi:hypothetical protein